MIGIIALGASSLIILFFIIILSSLGLPWGMITLISSGSLAGSVSNLILIILVSFIAVVIGDILVYSLARKFSDKLRDKLNKFYFFRANEIRARSLINRYGFFIVFFTRFISLCAVTSYVSGFEKMNRKKFILAVILGEFVYAILYPLIGFTVGTLFYSLITAINDVIIVALLVALAFYLIRFFIRRKRNL